MTQERESTGAFRYGDTWKREEDLNSLNLRIHDGVALEQLIHRARGYRDLFFEAMYPQARPQQGDWALEFGSGVGWIMQAMLEKYPLSSVTGLDISENMIARAQERLNDPRANFVHYDGLHIPLETATVPIIYSCAVIQHIEKHIAFILMKELHRILKPGGHAVLHFTSVDNILMTGMPYEEECWNHIHNRETHWHHYYSFDELYVWFSELIGVDELDIRHGPNFELIVHYSKGTGRKFARPEVPKLTYKGRMGGER